MLNRGDPTKVSFIEEILAVFFFLRTLDDLERENRRSVNRISFSLHTKLSSAIGPNPALCFKLSFSLTLPHV